MKKDEGLVKMVIVLVIALALLKYFFNWSIFDALESERGRDTVFYIRNVLNTLWSYLEAPVKYIWNEIVLPLISQVIGNLKTS